MREASSSKLHPADKTLLVIWSLMGVKMTHKVNSTIKTYVTLPLY